MPHLSSVPNRTTQTALAAAVVVATAAVTATLWPVSNNADSSGDGLAEFNDEVAGQEMLVVDLGPVDMPGLPKGASATLEIVLRPPPPAQQGAVSAGLTVLVEASEPLLLDGPSTATIKISDVGGPLGMRRMELVDQGRVVSGLTGPLPWGLVIGLASGAPASLQLGDNTLVFPATTQERVLKALRRLRAKGYAFKTFEIDIDTGQLITPQPQNPKPGQGASPTAKAPAPTARGGPK